MEDKYNDYDAFEKHMETTYPKMFAESYGGFAIGKGWWRIIDILCQNIQSHIDWKQKHGECPQVIVRQIKEKFGGLRFYFDGGDEYINGMVRMAENWANSTCEACGERGTMRTGGWIRTLCDKHEAEYQAQKSQDD